MNSNFNSGDTAICINEGLSQGNRPGILKLGESYVVGKTATCCMGQMITVGITMTQYFGIIGIKGFGAGQTCCSKCKKVIDEGDILYFPSTWFTKPDILTEEEENMVSELIEESMVELV